MSEPTKEQVENFLKEVSRAQRKYGLELAAVEGRHDYEGPHIVVWSNDAPSALVARIDARGDWEVQS